MELVKKQREYIDHGLHRSLFVFHWRAVPPSLMFIIAGIRLSNRASPSGQKTDFYWDEKYFLLEQQAQAGQELRIFYSVLQHCGLGNTGLLSIWLFPVMFVHPGRQMG